MAPRKPPRIPFPKKNQRPAESEFAARLPLAAGKRFEATRGFLKKQKGVTEELYYYGPRAGWTFRYLRAPHPVCSLMIHEDRPVGIVSLDPACTAAVDWPSLSEVGQAARKHAHGSPSLLWLHVPLDGGGAADFKKLVQAKLKALPLPPPQPAAAPAIRPPEQPTGRRPG